MKKSILITGGIGSGKSVVSEYLRLMGYFVYDCDKNAKILMNTNNALKQELIECFGADVIIDNKINTQKLKLLVFNDKHALCQINAIVHPYVANDIQQRINTMQKGYFFYESAIPKTGKIEALCDETWLVTASLNTRIERVIKRNNFSKEEVIKRIQLQTQEYNDLVVPNEIINDEPFALLPQIRTLLNL